MPIIGILASSRREPALAGIAGYFVGGITSGTVQNSIFKYTFSGDTTSTISATIGTSRYFASGMTNYGVAGYVAGGYSASSVQAADKMTYSNETRSALTITFYSTESAGCTDSGTTGYQIAGYGLNADQSNTYKLAFSNDTFSSGTNAAITARALGPYANNKGSRGYYGGGTAGGTAMYYYQFSNDTTATISGTLSKASYPQSVSDEGTSFIMTATTYGSSPTTLNKFPFSTETRTTLSATLTGVGPGGAVTNLGSYGLYSRYQASTSEKITYSTDTVSAGTSFSSSKDSAGCWTNAS